MAFHGANGEEFSSKTSEVSERSSRNPEMLHATNAAAALRIAESGSSSSVNKRSIHEGAPSYDLDGPQPKKRCLNRIASQQAQILESFFSVCAHPTETQRKELGVASGLSENQVKFWFQNKRTQVKHVSGKEENYRLRTENEILREENNKLKQMIKTIFCPSCTSEPSQLQILQEFERLKVQNQWMQQELARLNSELPISLPALSRAYQTESSSENVFVHIDDARNLANIARDAVHEFASLANSDGLLWISVPGGSLEILNVMAYLQAFPGQSSAMEVQMMEATRANSVIMMGSKNIVDFLMDAESYGTLFPGVLSGATTTKVYNWPSNRNLGYDGALEMVTVEVVFPSPLVRARKRTFLRHCKTLENGATAIVDISVEDGDGTLMKCRKMASGVLIEPISSNSCKVIVIEHVRVEDTDIHDLFKPCVSGLLLGARRLVVSMARQCARIRDVFHVTNISLSVNTTGKKIIMKVADTMLANYASSIAGIPVEDWTVQCGQGTEADVKITYRIDDNRPDSVIVCVCASFFLPMPMKTAFDLLKNHLLRPKWDVLVEGGSIKEDVRVANGVRGEDSVSILHVKHDSVGGKETTTILQNSSYDASGAFLVYSALDKQILEMITNREDGLEMFSVPVFPTGFSFAPIADPAQPNSAIGEAGGTVMTAGFQIPMKLARGTGLSSRSVASAIKILQDQIGRVKNTVMNSHPIFYRGIL